MAAPRIQELAPADHGLMASTTFTKLLIENPDTILSARGRQYRIYDELLRDDQVGSTFQQRRTGLTSKGWRVEAASDAPNDQAFAEFVTEQLEHVGWDDKCDKMLYGVFYGFAVAECMWARDGRNIVLDDLRVRDRSRFKFDEDHLLHLISTDKPQGEAMPDRKFWTYSAGASHDDNPYGLGLAHSLYWPVFFKRSDIKFWLIFLEKFGMPTVGVRVQDGLMDDPKTMDRARDVIESIQADSGVTIPESMVIDLIEAARSGTADYDALVERMDKAISKVVLSQTMTTDDGSSLSQAKVHEDVSKAVIDADADLLNDSFRRQVLGWLRDWNFPGAELPNVVRDTEPEEDLNQRAERDQHIHALGFQPTEEYIEDTYGPGWERRETPAVDPLTAATGLGQLPAEFNEVSPLLDQRAAHRADQQLLQDGARRFAAQYQALYGERVEQLLSYLEESGDVETFKRRITEMMAEAPPAHAIDAVQRASFGARLMGLFRGQRS
ncbi:MAG: DUF935 family protein [Pseudomonadota bacterium]